MFFVEKFFIHVFSTIIWESFLEGDEREISCPHFCVESIICG